MQNILKIETVHTGGSVMVDAIYLENGRVIAVAEDGIAIYPNEQAFTENKVEGTQVLYFTGGE